MTTNDHEGAAEQFRTDEKLWLHKNMEIMFKMYI